jgi:hypothetical protein
MISLTVLGYAMVIGGWTCFFFDLGMIYGKHVEKKYHPERYWWEL